MSTRRLALILFGGVLGVFLLVLLAISAPAFVALQGPFLPVLGVLSALLLGATPLR